MKNKIVLLILLVLFFISLAYFRSNQVSVSNFYEKADEHLVETKGGKTILDNNYSWHELGIKPVKSFEGSNYVFTAFDYNPNTEELLIAISSEKNTLKFVKNSSITEVELSDIPLDVLCDNENIFLLCLKKIIVIKNKRIIHELNHDIKNIMTFDKLLFFENYFTILMSDGSSYRYVNNSLQKSASLLVNNKQEVWIQKSSPHSFEIKSKPNNSKINKKIIYPYNIGSITFFGETMSNYYVIIDVIEEKNQKLFVKRELKSSIDNFNKTILKLPSRNFSYIKNDIKIHNNMLFSANVSHKSLRIKSTEL